MSVFDLDPFLYVCQKMLLKIANSWVSLSTEGTCKGAISFYLVDLHVKAFLN